MDDGRRRWTDPVGRTVAVAWSWGPVIAWLMLIFLVSGQPDEHGGLHLGNVIPKVAHFVEYAVLGILLARATGDVDLPLGDRRALLLILFIGLYAASDELHQAFVPSREPRVTDMAIDVLGGIAGLIAWRYFARRRRRA